MATTINAVEERAERSISYHCCASRGKKNTDATINPTP
jgi:hypothetical protein